MKATTVVILALLGVAAGRNIFLLKEEHYLQLIEDFPSNPREDKAPTTEADETVDAKQPETRSKKPFIDKKMLEQIFKKINSKPEAYKDSTETTRKAETGENVSPVEVDEDKMGAVDRSALVGAYCPNGVWIGGHCEPED